MPTPAPASRTPDRVRTRLLSRPYGPSNSTRVPGRTRASRALPSPSARAVIRRLRPSGAADRENGFDRVQPGPSRNRTLRNCPARTGSRSRRRPVRWTDTTSLDSRTTDVTRSRWRTLRTSGSTTRHPRIAPAAAGPQRPPVPGGRRGEQELLPGPELVRQGQTDAQVCVQVQQVPRLVPQPPSGRPDAGRRDHDQADGPGHRQQHTAVVGHQRPAGRQHGAPPTRGVPAEDQPDVQQHQGERHEADHPVDPHQPVTAVRVLEDRQPGHQQDLHQEKVGGPQTGDPAGRREPAGPGRQIGQAAVADPPVRHHQQPQPQAEAAGQPDDPVPPRLGVEPHRRVDRRVRGRIGWRHPG